MTAPIPGVAAQADWQPGDPLHHRGQYRNYLFNFREDTDSEECHCPDAATWPEPRGGSALAPGDEIGDLIRAERAAREEQAC
jgi:hypothetical protein